MAKASRFSVGLENDGGSVVKKADWGTKRVCQSCGCKFYDLQRSPIVCPSCGAGFDPEALLKSRRIRSAPVAKPEKPAAPAKPVEKKAEDELEELAEKTEDLEEDDALIVDADELGDDDDLGDVVVEKDEEQT